MADLPARPDLEQLHHQAKDLLRAARERRFGGAHADRGGRGPPRALVGAARARARVRLRELAEAEARGRAARDPRQRRCEAALGSARRDPDLASEPMEHWCDHPQGASPLGYTAMLRYDTSRDEWRDVDGDRRGREALLAAGAPVNGEPGEQETPLITAASYGDAEVAHVLIEAGADLEATAADDSGGVPGGTALSSGGVRHDRGGRRLVAAGARVQRHRGGCGRGRRRRLARRCAAEARCARW